MVPYPLATFWVIWEEREGFQGIDSNFDKLKDTWFHILSFLFKSHPFGSNEYFGEYDYND